MKETLRIIREKISSFTEWKTFGFGLAIGCVSGIGLAALFSHILRSI